jgi:ATP-dependent DNA helicase RecG
LPAQAPFRHPLESWPGVGPAVAARLVKLGVMRPEDLLFLLPLRYEDETRVTPVAQAQAGSSVLVEGRIVRVERKEGPRPQLVAHLDDGTGLLTGRWLHVYAGTAKRLEPGKHMRWFGEIRVGFFGEREMFHPRLVPIESPLPDRLTPVYPSVEGLSQGLLRRLVRRALEVVAPAEWLDETLRAREHLPPLREALEFLHTPPAGADERRLEYARRRLKLEELVAQQASMRRARAVRLAATAPALPEEEGPVRRALREALPFTLTAAQRRVLAEIDADLEKPHPMHRLLLGDVGSGKTVVAALALARALDGGHQGALMVPTEILAVQHARKLGEWLAPAGIEVALLTAATPAKAAQALRARLAEGEPLLVVGTHALIEEAVALPRLALAVVDEQHRFGVRQRFALRAKAGEGLSPHLLMMSATPIPRTLALAIYADLEVSLLDERPPGRQPVQTVLLSQRRRGELIERVRRWCAQGRQAYWVCPLIEESEVLDLQAATATWQELAATMPELRVGLLHGRLKNEEKQEVMARFVAGALDVLVATTVIEVGVDVANASLMVIDHAERFGLAQLHQLRGRVGRGSEASFCVLCYGEPLSATARERLAAIRANDDGFALAREDLRLRGPGEFVGLRQSGVPSLRVADLVADEDLVPLAQQLADEVLARDPALAETLIRRWVPGGGAWLHA